MILPVALNNAVLAAVTVESFTVESLSGALQTAPALTGLNTATGELTGVIGAIQAAVGQVQSTGTIAGTVQTIPTQQGQLQEGL